MKQINTPEQQRTLAELAASGARYADAKRALDAIAAERDRVVLAASATGASRRDVAAAAGITAGRVQQILAREQ